MCGQLQCIASVHHHSALTGFSEVQQEARDQYHGHPSAGRLLSNDQGARKAANVR